MNLNELVYNLAVERAALKTMQDEVERLMEHCEALEIHCEALLLETCEAAIATGEAHPHPAVTVCYPLDPDLTPYVDVKRDLTPWLQKGGDA